jgi:hypothetical protein
MIDLGLEWLWAALAGAVGLLAVWLGGRRSAKTAAKIETLKSEVQAHDRITNADTGAGLSDDQRIDRLRDYAKRHGN